jgi:hypothetical protein
VYWPWNVSRKGAGLAVAMLGQIDLRHAFFCSVFVVDLVAVDQQDHVSILLD